MCIYIYIYTHTLIVPYDGGSFMGETSIQCMKHQVLFITNTTIVLFCSKFNSSRFSFHP